VAKVLHLQEPDQELLEDLPVVGLLVRHLLEVVVLLPHCCCCWLVCSRVERVRAQKWEGKARMRSQARQATVQGAATRSPGGGGAGRLEMRLRRRAGACVQQGQPEGCGWAPAC